MFTQALTVIYNLCNSFLDSSPLSMHHFSVHTEWSLHFFSKAIDKFYAPTWEAYKFTTKRVHYNSTQNKTTLVLTVRDDNMTTRNFSFLL